VRRSPCKCERASFSRAAAFKFINTICQLYDAILDELVQVPLRVCRVETHAIDNLGEACRLLSQQTNNAQAVGIGYSLNKIKQFWLIHVHIPSN